MTPQHRVPGLVSTIIPVHNRARLLHEAVASVLAQTYRPIEIIIVDDGSTDDTPAQAQAIAASHPAKVHVIQQANTGPGLAREAGRRLARGEFLQYLDSDDLLLPEKFALQVPGLQAHPECGVSYCQTRYRHANGSVHPGPWKGTGRCETSMFPSMLIERWWDTPTPLYRASVCDAAGPWSGLRLEEDWEYDCRIAALQTSLHFIQAYLVEVRDHADARLSRGTATDPLRLAMRAGAHALIHSHAVRAGLRPGQPEMEHFSRALFLLARQCGAAGLIVQASRLLALARQCTSQPGRLQLRAYSAAAHLFGHPLAGRLSCLSDKFRQA